jgi:hypothetical protein
MDLLEQLGLSKEELQERVINTIADKMLSEVDCDEDGNEVRIQSRMQNTIRDLIKAQIDEKVTEIADANILPRVTEMVENLVLQETNKWGEKTGEKLTFTEYLVKRADHYLREEVDRNGQSIEEIRYSSDWRKDSTRIMHVVHGYLSHNVTRALKEAVENANKSIAGGLEGAVKMALDNIVKNLKVSVSTKA